MALGPGASQTELWKQIESYRDALGSRTGSETQAWIAENPLPSIDKNCQPTERSLSSVASQHGMTQGELASRLAGQLALDVGGGFSMLHNTVSRLGGNVITLDTPATFSKGVIENGVMGLAQRMPFRCSNFDLVLATYSLPSHAAAPRDIEMFIDEGLRVLKPGGSFLIAPLTVHDTSSQLKNRTWYYFLDRLINMANNSPHELELKLDESQTKRFYLPAAVEITK